MNMYLPYCIKTTTLFCLIMLMCVTSFASEDLFLQARKLQRDGNYDEAIKTYKTYLTTPIEESELTDKQLFLYTEGLVQLMNTYQSKGEPEACISALQEVFNTSSILQRECLRDFYSVKGYALSRTDRMSEAEETMLKALALPLHRATPERYFRDYAYAAAVFYSNPNYQKEVISWCEEALQQAELSNNGSGAQYIKTMLGSLYKRHGHLNEALELFQESRANAEQNGDDLGVLNSLNALTDIFIFYDIPEYANMYASEAMRVEGNMKTNNPMISAQTYINKGRALYKLGEIDSVTFYTEKARKICESLPYNSGMVDVNLLCGKILTEQGGGESRNLGIEELQMVTKQGTAFNRAKAYHQLAQTYIEEQNNDLAEAMLDSLYTLLNNSDSPMLLRLDYEPILNHYFKNNNHAKVEQYTKLMLAEQKIFKQRRLNFNLVESIVTLQTEQKNQELKIAKLTQTNQRLLLLICVAVAITSITVMAMLYISLKRRFTIQMRRADEQFATLAQELNESNVEKEKVTQEIKEFLKESDNRMEMETLTPFILKESGETKFRQCFELLHPLFLHRLRERVPSITRREELLSMLIVLKQDNREIAELLAIAPRSVLMLRHRFRQKIGMATEYSLENFIEDALGDSNSTKIATETSESHE